MAINRYMLPAEQKVFQTYVPQYAPQPIEDVAKYRQFGEALEQPLTNLQGQFIEGEVFKTDIPAFTKMQDMANQEMTALADKVDKFQNPFEYKKEAAKITNKYAKPLSTLLKQRENKLKEDLLQKKFGTDAFYFGEKDPLQASLEIDEQGRIIDRGYDPESTFVQRADYLKANQQIGDRVLSDMRSLGLSQSSIEGYLRTGVIDELDKKKIDRVLSDENLDASINASPELQQRLRTLTEQNSLIGNFSGPEARNEAMSQLRDEITQAAYQNVSRKVKDQYQFDRAAAEKRAYGRGQAERQTDYIPDAYTQLLDKAGKGSGAKVTEKQGAWLFGQEPKKNEETGFLDFTDNSFNKMLSVPEGDVLAYKQGLEDLDTRQSYNDLKGSLDEALKVLYGENQFDNSLNAEERRSKYPSKEEFLAAIRRGDTDFLVNTASSPAFGQEHLGGGVGSDAQGIQAQDILNKILPQLDALESDLSDRYGSTDKFLEATNEESAEVKNFRLGQKLSGINLPNVHLSTNDRNTNVRNINGQTYIDVETAMNGKQFKQALKAQGVTDEDLVLMREQGILKGEGESWNIAGGDIDGWEDIDDESIYSFKYISEHEPDETIRSNFSGSTHKTQHGQTLENPQIVNQQQQFSYSMGNNAFANGLTQQTYTLTPEDFKIKMVSSNIGLSESDLNDPKINSRINSIYKIKNTTDRFAALSKFIDELRRASLARQRQ